MMNQLVKLVEKFDKLVEKVDKMLEKFDKTLSKVKRAQADLGDKKHACKGARTCNHIR